MLVVKELQKYFSGRPLYRPLNFSLQQKEVLVVSGPSGSGKTTLLKILCGLEKPSFGSVEFLGRDITRLSPAAMPYLRRNMGFIFQDFRLIPHMKVWENIALPLWIRGEDRIKERVEREMDRLGISALASRMPLTLSGGEQQLVAIARVAVMEPVVVLADEPLGSLDKDSGDMVAKALMDLVDRGAGMLIATHDTTLHARLNARSLKLERPDEG